MTREQALQLAQQNYKIGLWLGMRLAQQAYTTRPDAAQTQIDAWARQVRDEAFGMKV